MLGWLSETDLVLRSSKLEGIRKQFDILFGILVVVGGLLIVLGIVFMKDNGVGQMAAIGVGVMLIAMRTGFKLLYMQIVLMVHYVPPPQPDYDRIHGDIQAIMHYLVAVEKLRIMQFNSGGDVGKTDRLADQDFYNKRDELISRYDNANKVKGP